MPNPQPRHHTPRNPHRRTLGGKAAKLAALLGKPFMPWQRMAADVALELNDDASFHYHEVIISVPRQSGKTAMTLILGLHRLLTTPGGKIWYTAQSGLAARERFLDMAPNAMKRLPGLLELKRGAGDTRLNFPALSSQYRPHPPTDKYLHGEQSDLNLIDEPWAFTETQGDALMQAILPTHNTRPNAQIIYLSTMGTADSIWWHDLVDRAVTSLGDDDTRTCVIDWGVPDSHDVTLDAAIAAHPAVGHTIGERQIRDAWESMRKSDGTSSEFARAYGNQRTATRQAIFTTDELAHVLTDRDTIDPTSKIAVGAAVSWDRSRAVIAAAGWSPAGRIVAEIIDARPGVSWATDALATLHRTQRPLATWIDARSPAATLATDPTLADIIHTPDTRDVASATASWLDLMHTGDMTIRPDKEVAHNLDVLTLRTIGDLGDLIDRRRSAGSIAACEAIILAVGALTHAPAPAPAPFIWSM